MKLLKRIIRRKGINLKGKISFRTAVRGIILSDGKLLMIYSAAKGDYKFPGGGVADGETHAQALVREIREECGATVRRVGDGFGKVVEYDFAEKPGYDTFKMESYYYWCEIETHLQPQILDDYEADLGFQPVWIPVEEAIRANKILLKSSQDPEIYWLKRETYVLGKIQKIVTENGEFLIR